MTEVSSTTAFVLISYHKIKEFLDFC